MIIRKLLISNRGEIASRIIRSAHDMGISCVAIYTEADTNTPYVREADQAFKLSDTYLNAKEILEIAKKNDVDAIHPGYGFLSENYNFVKALEKEKIKFIGPNKNAIIKMGDKIESKNLANKLKLNIIPGHTEAIKDPKKAIKISEKIGFQFYLKHLLVVVAKE